MPIDPQEDPPINPGQPTEPPQEDPPGNPLPETPPPMREPGESPSPEELPGNLPQEIPVRGPEGPSTPAVA
jgi:hypothetical protein